MTLISVKASGDVIASSDFNAVLNKIQNGSDTDIKLNGSTTSDIKLINLVKNVASATEPMVHLSQTNSSANCRILTINSAGIMGSVAITNSNSAVSTNEGLLNIGSVGLTNDTALIYLQTTSLMSGDSTFLKISDQYASTNVTRGMLNIVGSNASRTSSLLTLSNSSTSGDWTIKASSVYLGIYSTVSGAGYAGKFYCTGAVNATALVAQIDNASATGTSIVVYNNGSGVGIVCAANGTGSPIKLTPMSAPTTSLSAGCLYVSSSNNLYLYDGIKWKGVGSFVDATPSSNTQASGTTITLTANETHAFGDICKIHTDGDAILAKADVIANASAIVMCADSSITGGNSGNYLLMGVARNDTWNWTVGGLIYLSTTGTTGNTLTQTAPTGTNNVVQVVGVATHADRMYFNPCLVQVELT